MIQALPFIPKQDHELPDSYGMKIYYVNGKSDEFDVASHRVIKETASIEFVTKDDLWSIIPLTSIQRLEFDRRFSKVLALNKDKHANPV
jgi:hypothetical protein